jgi:selenocysteine lyase/cysteine desulfurase
MYAYRLLTDLGVDLNDGVVRLSAVHYNTVTEIDKCIQVLDSILSNPE